MWTVRSERQFEALTEIRHTKSERVVAIVGGALVDDSLLITLTGRLRNDQKAIAEYFDPEKPAGSFNARNRLAYLLGVYHTEVYQAVSGIATVRNHFAHKLDASFVDPGKDISKAWGRLSLHVGMQFYPSTPAVKKQEKIGKLASKRDIYLAHVRIIIGLLMQDAYEHFTYSNAPLPKTLRGKSPRILRPPSQDPTTT